MDRRSADPHRGSPHRTWGSSSSDLGLVVIIGVVDPVHSTRQGRSQRCSTCGNAGDGSWTTSGPAGDEIPSSPGRGGCPRVVHSVCRRVAAGGSPVSTWGVDEASPGVHPQAFPHLWRHRCTSVTCPRSPDRDGRQFSTHVDTCVDRCPETLFRLGRIGQIRRWEGLPSGGPSRVQREFRWTACGSASSVRSPGCRLSVVRP